MDTEQTGERSRLQLVIYGAIFVLSCFYLVGSLRLGLGNIANPGPGFFPLIVSLLLSLSSLVVTFQYILRLRSSQDRIFSSIEVDSSKFSKIIVVVMSLLVYIATIHQVGFLLSTFWLIMAALWASGERRAVRMIVISALASLFVELVFVNFLLVPLPSGILKV